MLIQTLSHAKLVKARWEFLWQKELHPFLSFDTETLPLPPFGKKFDALIPQRADVNIFSMCYRGEAYSFPTSVFNPKYPTPEDWGEFFIDWFINPKIIIVMHNANYDLNIAKYSLVIPVIRNFWCTMIGAWKASEFKDKGLKARAPTYGRYWRETATVNFSQIEELSEYAEQDVVQTDELFQMQYFGKVVRPKVIYHINSIGKLIKSSQKLPSGTLTFEHEDLSIFDKAWLNLQEFPVLSATVRAERRGFPFNVVRLRKIRKKLNVDIEVLLKRIYRMVGDVINLNSGPMLEKAFIKLGISNPYKTKTGRSSFNVQALSKMQGMHEFIDMILKYRGLEKFRSVYVGSDVVNFDDLKNDDSGLEYHVNPRTGCIHCSMNTVGAVTGRNSAQNPNLQQIPSRKDVYKIRACFTAVPFGIKTSPRYKRPSVLIVLDYSQLEIRVMCLYCKDKNMQKVLRDRKGDIHQHTADEFGVPRSPHAKNLNFLLLYGGREHMLSETLTLFGVPTTHSQAHAFIEKHEEVYPRIAEFRKELLEEHAANGFVRLFHGRRRTLPDVDWDNKHRLHNAETTLSNNVVQGSGQDFLKAAIIRSDWRCINPDREFIKKVNCKTDHRAYLKDKATILDHHRAVLKKAECNFLLQVHDEAIFKVIPSAAEECLHILADIMSWRHFFPAISSYNVPLVAEGGIGDDWIEAKSDDAKAHVKVGFDEWEKYAK